MGKALETVNTAEMPALSGTAVPDSASEPVLAIAKKLSPGFLKRAEQLDKKKGVPFENIDEIRSSGLLFMALPSEFGGRDASLLDVAQVLHEIAKGCPSTALIFNMHLALSGQIAHMWRSNPDDIWSRWLKRFRDQSMLLGGALSESSSWNAAMLPQAKAERVKGGFKVNGSRSFCTGSSHLDLMQCTAHYITETGQKKCLYFIIPAQTEGVIFKDDWDTLGMRASASQGFLLEDVFVPNETIVYEYEYGLLDFSEIWLSFLTWSFIGFASVYSGIADYAKEFSTQLVTQRSRAPGTHPLIHKPTVQIRTAEMNILNETMCCVREHVSQRYPNGQPFTVQSVIDSAIAKQVCVTKAIEVVDHAVSIVGGQAYYEKLPLGRLYRDVRAGPFHPFSVDDSLEIMGKLALGINFLEPGGWAL